MTDPSSSGELDISGDEHPVAGVTGRGVRDRRARAGGRLLGLALHLKLGGKHGTFEQDKPGDHVIFRAEMDCICVMSACPQDILPINAGNPVEAHFEVLG